MASRRRALVVATYEYADDGLRRLAAPQHDAESFAEVLKDDAIAGFDVTMLVNQPHYAVGEAIADFYGGAGREDLTLLYFTGHGVKDDEGRLYLAMTNTRRDALMFTAISGAQLNDAMDASRSRRKVLILDCCYSGAFPPGRTAKADEGVQTIERFQGKGRAVLTASDATQYAFEGDDLRGSGTSSVFTRYLVDAISSGAADLDEDGDIALDELYSYVYDRVVAEVPQQRPKKQEDVDGRILIARNVHWKLPEHVRHAVESPITAQRLSAVQELGYLYRAGNDVVRAAVLDELSTLGEDDSRSVSAAAAALVDQFRAGDDTTPRSPTGTPRAPLAPSAVPAPARPRPAPAVVTAPASPPAGGVPPVPPPPEPRQPAPSEAGGGAVAQKDARIGRAVPAGWILSLLAVAAAALVVCLFVPRYSDGYVFDLGLTAPWILGMDASLVGAAVLIVRRPGSSPAMALAAGLIAGPAVIAGEQVAFGIAGVAERFSHFGFGPGWALLLLALVTLASAARIVMSRRAGRGPRPTIARSWRAGMAIVILAGLGTWIAVVGSTSLGVAFWFESTLPMIVLTATTLPTTVLALTREQATFALTTVAVYGTYSLYSQASWLVRSTGNGYGAKMPATALACAAAAIAACFVAQWPSRRRAQDPAEVVPSAR